MPSDSNKVATLLKFPIMFSKLKAGDTIIAVERIIVTDIGAGIFEPGAEFEISGTQKTSFGKLYVHVNLTPKHKGIILPIDYFLIIEG